MGTPTIAGLTEFNSVRNKVGSIHYEVDSGVVPIKMPLTSSENSLGLNLLGKSVNITLSGEYHGTTAQIIAFLSEYRAWADKDQLAGETVALKEFDDGFFKWNVKPMRMEYDHNLRMPNQVTYTLTLFRSIL